MLLEDLSKRLVHDVAAESLLNADLRVPTGDGQSFWTGLSPRNDRYCWWKKSFSVAIQPSEMQQEKISSTFGKTPGAKPGFLRLIVVHQVNTEKNQRRTRTNEITMVLTAKTISVCICVAIYLIAFSRTRSERQELLETLGEKSTKIFVHG